MSDRKYSKKLDAILVRTTGGEDWVGYKSENEIHHGTMTKLSWDSLDEAPYEIEGEWPYTQEG